MQSKFIEQKMNSKFIIGLDEAGRGALAGPIVAAAVVSRGLDCEVEILKQVKDSKKLSPLQREKLFLMVSDNFIWSVAVIDNVVIDQSGIQPVNCLVIEKALENILAKINNEDITIVSDYVGSANKYFKNKQIQFYKHGESVWPQIAAASIMAKVYRDRLMCDLAKQYDGYNFEIHKGYGTAMHLDCLKKIGTCPIHRLSFLTNYL